MVLQSASLSLTDDNLSVTHVEKKVIYCVTVSSTRHKIMVMEEARNLATIIRTRTLREKINSHAISLAGAIINSHTERMGINHTMVAEMENLVTRSNHRRVVMVIRNLAAIIMANLVTTRIEAVLGAEKLVITKQSVQISQV